MNIIGKRKIWYAISGIFMILSLISLAINGLKLGLDFKGGSSLKIKGAESQEKIIDVLESKGFNDASIISEGEVYTIKTGILDNDGHKKLIDALEGAKKDGQKITEIQFLTVGATISKDITTKAYLSIGLGLLVIILYVAYSFRKTSKYFASWKYGTCAVLAVFHDVIFVVGAFSFMGFFWGIEIDSLFITALLTVISFSVHDTIVIFDRIRENLKHALEDNFEEIVNRSIEEMIGRSLNTTLVILLVILSMILLGGESVRYFVLAIFMGIFVGTYSTIFVASPLLVSWKNFESMKASKSKK